MLRGPHQCRGHVSPNNRSRIHYLQPLHLRYQLAFSASRFHARPVQSAVGPRINADTKSHEPEEPSNSNQTNASSRLTNGATSSNGTGAGHNLPLQSNEIANAPSSSNVVAPSLPGAGEPLAEKYPHRWSIVAMMAVAFVLCNMDKVNMSVAVIPMAHELGWTALDRGLVSSSFFWGYTLTQIPGGYISTKIGGARVLMAGVALWSFGTAIAPPAAQMSLLALCASRVLVGLGEGFAPSAATSVLARIMPANERSRAVAAVWGGLDVGSAVGLLLSGPLIRLYGWPSVFYLFAIMGLVWCMFWPLVKPEASAEQINQQHSTGASSSKTIEQPSEDIQVPWLEFAKSPPVWAVTVAHFCFNWGYYTLLAWLPSYFELALGLDVGKSSFLTLIPYLAMTAMMPLVGPMADTMVERGMSLTSVRKICQNIAFIGPAACMIACALLTPPAVSPANGAAASLAASQTPVGLLVGLLSLGFALGAWSRGGLYCNHQDLSPKYAGALLGITNTAGALPGVLGVTAAGYLLDQTNSWALALFYPTAACQLFGSVVYSIFASSKRQSWS